MAALITRYQAVAGNWSRQSNPYQEPVTPPPAIGDYKPTAVTTGYDPSKLVLSHAGDWSISTPGTYEGYDVTGQVKINASGVTLRNCRIRGHALSSGGGYQLLYTKAGLSNVLVEDCEIYFEPAVGLTDQSALTATYVYAVNAMQLQSGTVRRCNVHTACDTAQVLGANVTVEGNYLHGNIHLTSDPNWSGSGSHDDGIQVEGGAGHRIYGNTIEGGYNGGIMVTQNVDNTTNLTIEKNWLGGGGATVNVSEKGRGPLTGLRIVDNRFLGTSRLAGFEILLPSTTRSVATITGNVMDADGSPANIRNG